MYQQQACSLLKSYLIKNLIKGNLAAAISQNQMLLIIEN